jgi:NAD(P)-dependent dehydrogenase (short-subunit alcohol dehydrogenase family)
LDLSATNAIADLSAQIRRVFPTVDVLVNNAAVAIFKPFASATREDLEQQFDLNVKSVLLLTQGLLPALERSKGNIINIFVVSRGAGHAGASCHHVCCNQRCDQQLHSRVGIRARPRRGEGQRDCAW